MTRSSALAVLMSGTLATAACAQAASAPPTSASARWEWATHSADGATRRYRLYVPAAYDGARALPLLVMLHGCTQDPDDFARGTRMNAVAEELGFLVAYPEQTASLNPQRCWTWYDPAHQGRAGEPEQIAGIAREVAAGFRVDPARIYVAGVSAGGAMAVNAAAAYPDVFAAAAAHSGVAYRAAGGVTEALAVMQRGAAGAATAEAAMDAVRARGGPLPMIALHGQDDAVVRVVNGHQLLAQWGAAGEPDDVHTSREVLGGLEVTRYWRGRGEAPVAALLVVSGLGHAWSGGSTEGTYTDPRGPDASREIARFLLAHRGGGR